MDVSVPLAASMGNWNVRKLGTKKGRIASGLSMDNITSADREVPILVTVTFWGGGSVHQLDAEWSGGKGAPGSKVVASEITGARWGPHMLVIPTS